MKKYTRMYLFTLIIILSLQNIAFASDRVQKSSKPTDGVESLVPNHGSSINYKVLSPESTGGLLTSWYCDIYNTGTDLYLLTSNTTKYSVEEMKITLYLQKWNGSTWVDINYWIFYGYTTGSITNDTFADYQPGNYYRVRAIHYAKDGFESDIQYSTSSYIYVP